VGFFLPSVPKEVRDLPLHASRKAHQPLVVEPKQFSVDPRLGVIAFQISSFEKFYRSKKVAVVCNGACRCPFCLERVEQPVELARAIQKAVLGVHVQMGNGLLGP